MGRARREMSDGTILLLGATSDIGGEVATRLCAGRDVVLSLIHI